MSLIIKIFSIIQVDIRNAKLAFIFLICIMTFNYSFKVNESYSLKNNYGYHFYRLKFKTRYNVLTNEWRIKICCCLLWLKLSWSFLFFSKTFLRGKVKMEMNISEYTKLEGRVVQQKTEFRKTFVSWNKNIDELLRISILVKFEGTPFESWGTCQHSS